MVLIMDKLDPKVTQAISSFITIRKHIIRVLDNPDTNKSTIIEYEAKKIEIEKILEGLI